MLLGTVKPYPDRFADMYYFTNNYFKVCIRISMCSGFLRISENIVDLLGLDLRSVERRLGKIDRKIVPTYRRLWF